MELGRHRAFVLRVKQRAWNWSRHSTQNRIVGLGTRPLPVLSPAGQRRQSQSPAVLLQQAQGPSLFADRLDPVMKVRLCARDGQA